MVVPVVVPLMIPVFAFGAITKAIKGLYGMAGDINEYLDSHIVEMKRSDNPTVAKTGRVIEMAKLGFGIGYMGSVIIIAMGQFLLGNTFAAVVTVATAATLSNPIAMTCAAMGAILYGWNALSDQEKNEILDKLSRGLEVGVELIRSIVNFVIDTARQVMDSKVLKDLKSFIADKAALFGRSLSDVTHSTLDAISDAGAAVKKHTGIAIDETRRVAGRTSDRLGEVFVDASGAIKKHTGIAIDGTRRAATRTGEKMGEVFNDATKVTGESFDAAGEATKKVIESGKTLVRRTRKDTPPK